MNAKQRLIRALGTAGVGLFFVASVAFGANAIGQVPGRAIDPALTTSDETASPMLVQQAEPTETAEPIETADDHDGQGEDAAGTAEPNETAEPAETAEPTETADDHDGQGEDASGTAEPAGTAEPTEGPDDHADGSGDDAGGSDDSAPDGSHG